MGCLPDSMFNEVQGLYCEKTEEIATECIKDAIDEEVAITMLESEEHREEYNGVTILSDARHGWRKNARHSDVIALGFKTNKVVGSIVVTKDDDNISQRHEMFGVKRLYEHFDESDVNVHIHGHDRNMVENKYLRVDQPHVTNDNDTWHVTKGINREVKKVCDGPQKYHGIQWHGELSDKAASIKTHCYYSMKNCQGSAERLKFLLDNIVFHYQNIHSHCLQTSRCKVDSTYESSKIIMKDPIAIKLLERAIHNLQLYKTPQDYVECVDTHYVESFNNACPIFHDKRIVFGDAEYKRRTQMAVLDWNENIDRQCTSVTFVEDPRHPRRRIGKRVLKRKTQDYTRDIWTLVKEYFFFQD